MVVQVISDSFYSYILHRHRDKSYLTSLTSKQYLVIFISYSMLRTGVHSVGYAFPKVRICTTAVDDILDEHFHIIPGIGKYILND